MSSFAGSITALFVAGMVGGYAGLCLLGPTDETQTMTVAAAPIPDPPALPCSMQAWPNADRKCLDWTAPRVRAATGQAPEDPAAPRSDCSRDPSLRRHAIGVAAFDGRNDADAAAAPASPADPGAGRDGARGQVAHGYRPCQDKALAVMRGFGDN